MCLYSVSVGLAICTSDGKGLRLKNIGRHEIEAHLFWREAQEGWSRHVMFSEGFGEPLYGPNGPLCIGVRQKQLVCPFRRDG